MKFQHELTYDATPAQVFAMLSDPAFRERVCQAQRVAECSVSIDGDDRARSVVVDQKRPSDGVPSAAKKFVGDQIHIRQSESWEGGTDAALEVAIPGKPAQLTGGIALRANGGGTVETVSGDVKVSIPLVGGKLEKMIGDLFASALRAEERVGRAWLAGDR